MDMQEYISIIEKVVDGLGIPGVYLATGIVAFCVLTTLLTLVSSGIKTRHLRKARAKEQEKHEAALAQLISQSQTLQTQVLQLEGQLQQKTSDHQHLENHINGRTDALRQLLKALGKHPELQATGTIDTDSASESILWQQHNLVINELSERLQTCGQQAAKLSGQNRSYKTHIDRLEVARMQVFNELNQITLKTKQLENSFSAKLALQQAKIDGLENQNHAYKANIDKLELNRMQVFNELNQATQKIHGLEASLQMQLQEQQENSTQTLAKLQSENSAQKTTIENQEAELVRAAQTIAQLESALKANQSANTPENPVLLPDQSSNIAEAQPEADIPDIQTETKPEPEASNTNNASPFGRFVNSLGFGKQHALAQDNEDAEAADLSQQEKAAEPITEEKPAALAAVGTIEETKTSNPFFTKAISAFGLGKQHPIEEVSVKAQEEPAQATAAELSEAGTKPTKPLFDKLIQSIGLGKNPAPATEPEPEVQQRPEETPSANQNTAVRNAKQMAGQLKSFFKKQ